jgi:hypothetical protein
MTNLLKVTNKCIIFVLRQKILHQNGEEPYVFRFFWDHQQQMNLYVTL